jgi:intracellular multiplication protein IcmL
MAAKPKQDRMMVAVLLLSASLVISAISHSLLIATASRTKQIPIAIDNDGRILTPAPLDQTNVADPRVLEFAQEAVRASFAHDFSNYRGTLGYAKKFYTSQGGRMLQDQMGPILEEMRRERAVMTSTTDVPVMQRSAFLFHGRIAWEVQIPLTIRFLGQRSAYSPRERVARLLVVQVPPEENVRGISVHTIQLEPYQKPN